MYDLSVVVTRKQWNGMFKWSDAIIGMVGGPSEARPRFLFSVIVPSLKLYSCDTASYGRTERLLTNE